MWFLTLGYHSQKNRSILERDEQFESLTGSWLKRVEPYLSRILTKRSRKSWLKIKLPIRLNLQLLGLVKKHKRKFPQQAYDKLEKEWRNWKTEGHGGLEQQEQSLHQKAALSLKDRSQCHHRGKFQGVRIGDVCHLGKFMAIGRKRQ